MSPKASIASLAIALACGVGIQTAWAYDLYDNAAIRQWAKDSVNKGAGSQTRIMPVIQKDAAPEPAKVAAAENQAAPQAAPQPSPAQPSPAMKGFTICQFSGLTVSEDATVWCGRLNNERTTVKSLYAKGWRITNVWTRNDTTYFIAEER
jgi:hypothetical protein